jgi:hypothetical protein
MKKLLITLLLIPLGFSAFGQFLTDWTEGMTPLQFRTAYNANNTTVEDTTAYFYQVNLLNGAAIDTALARAGRVGNGNVPPYFDGSSDGGTYLQFYGANGFWTALQGGAPTANRSYRLPIQALPGAGLRAFMVIDQFGNMQFKDSADVGGGAGDLAFADTVSGTGFLETQFRSDTAKAALRGEIAAISTGSGFVELADSVGTAAGTYLTGTGAAFIVSTIGSRLGVADTSDMLTPYATTGEVRNIVNDSLDARIGAGELAVSIIDTTSNAAGHYATYNQVNTGKLTRFYRAGGSLTLSGADSVTITTTANSNVTFPTSGTLATTTAVHNLADTVAFFAFGAGSGAVADSAVIKTTTIYGSFFNAGSDTLVITNTRAVMVDGAGTDTCSVAIQFHATFNSGSATILNGAATATGGSTKFTTGLSTSITTSNKIPPNVWVWMETPFVSAGNKPYMLSVTMSGYKKPTY